MTKLVSLVFVCIFLASCITATPAPPPRATARSGPPSTAALLPWYTNDQAASQYAYDQLRQCLERTGVFTFKPQSEVNSAVQQTGTEIEKIFGPSDEDFKAIGQALNVQYVLGGAFTILKGLTFSGWRKDITADMRVHQGGDGQEAGYWRSNTGFTWTSTDTALNAEKMSESAMNHLCAQIQAQGAF